MLQPSKNIEPIPGYVIKERIGVGGYGEVWSAQAPGGLSKAIKFVYGHFDDERAARELKALNRIKEVRHPFLLSLERFEIIDGQLLIVTELADMSLKDRFEQVKEAGLEHIPRDELMSMMRDAADALDYMGETFSLQHLDVKPENLLLVGGRVKVADFGLVKELQDVNASLMGGLTPVYASPEVFDGQPSSHSDQYSLAIVYQEMLTGVLPFPGRTAAQLASQHLHARPRLAPLPSMDQPIIARALSKDPTQRFPNCRALIDALRGADQTANGPQASSDSQQVAKADSTSDTTSTRSRAGSTDTDWQRLQGRGRDGVAPRSANVKTQVIGQEAGGTWDQDETAAAPMPLAAPTDAIDLPPIELTATETELRPTLFLGIGGTAGRTLRQLRRRLRDRFGQTAAIPAMQMLLLDTDAKALYQATQGDGDTALSDAETLSLPLRNAHDYTLDSRNILQWLSRRWLYNIPRSLKTEGRRPLGRLTLVDHAQQVVDRLRKAIVEITSAEAVSVSARTTGLRFATQAPRIFLVSSISGGAGGGMALDVAYVVRKILAELKLSDEGLCGILTHSTDRNPAAGDLAIANAYACLNELHHYSGPGSYPGEAACGLAPSEPGSATFPHAYFVHLGHNLNDDQFDQATDTLASFLYLNVATEASTAFDQCRISPPTGVAGPTLRSFGLACIGNSHTALSALATERLCGEVLDRWRGVNQESNEEPASASFVDLATRQDVVRGGTNKTEIEQLAADHASRLNLEFERLDEQVTALVEKELGGDADAVFANLRAKIGQQQEIGAIEQPAFVPRMLHAIDNLFGPSLSQDEPKNAASTSLRAALEQDLKLSAAPIGDAARQWILSLIEQPGARIGGACRAKEWYVGHLRSLETKCNDLLREVHQDIQAVLQALHGFEQAAHPRGRVFGTRRADKPSAERNGALLRIVRFRFEETVLHGLCKLLRLILAPLSGAGDQLKDLQRELGQLSNTLADPSGWDEPHGATTPPEVIDDVRSTVVGTLRRRMPQLAQAVDERFQSQFLEQHGGLRKVFQNADAMGSKLLAALRAEARAEIIRAVKEIPITDAVLGGQLPAESRGARLRTCVDAARPLTHCGGSQHLLAILPAGATGSALQEAFSTELDPPPTTIKDPDAELVFCYEVQELAIPYVAAQLITDRDDFVQIAARLHTRIDVVWSELAQISVCPQAECATK